MIVARLLLGFAAVGMLVALTVASIRWEYRKRKQDDRKTTPKVHDRWPPCGV